MKVSYELEQGYIDVWNEESEEWDRYIKVQKKSIVEDKKIKKIDRTKPFSTFDVAEKVDEIIDVLNEMREDK